MAVDTQAVQIRIDVVDNNSAAAVKGVEQNIQNLGSAGATSGDKVAKGMDQIKGHSLTALDNVRLLRDDIGVRIPRSMEKAIANSKFLMAGIGAIGTGLLALGAIDIGVRIGKGLYDAYEKWLSLGAAAKAYQDQVDKAKDEDFINVHDIETATARINEATAAARNFQNVAQQMHGSFWGDVARGMQGGGGVTGGVIAGIQDTYGARQMADAGYKRQGQADALKGPIAAEHHQAILDAIELSHAGDARLRGEQKITAEKNKQHAVNEENRKYETGVEGLKGNAVAPDAGKSKEHALDAIADQKADAETFNLRREHSIELQHMREAALEAGLRGVALYKAQEAAAIAELKNKDMDSVAARAAVHAKFHAEELRRLQDETRETEKIERTAAAAGMSGVAKIQAEGANRVGDINADETLDPENRARRVAAANLGMHQEMAAAEEEFTRKVNQLADDSATHQISGFARIHAEAQKEIDGLRQEFEKIYGTNPSAPEYKAHFGELQRGEATIGRGEAGQTSDLARKNADETEQIEAEARVKSLSAERQKTASIEAEYEQRLQKYREELGQQEISQNDFDRRVAAAAQERNAEMIEASRQAREKMAGEFSSFFKSLDHPTEALKNLGDKVAGEAAASLMQRIQQRGQHGAPAAPQAQQGGILGDILGGFGLGRSKTPAAPETGASASHVQATALNKEMRIAVAQIRIDSASFAGMGGGFTSSGGGAVPGIAGGSTALLAPGGAIARAAYTGESSPAWSGTGSTSSYGASATSSSSPWSGGAGVGDIAGSALATGGAGDASRPPAVSNFNAGSGAPPPPGQNKPAGILGDLQQGMGLFKSAKGVFGAGKSGTGASDQYAETQDPVLSGKLNADGTFTEAGTKNGGMLGGGGIGANAMGAAGGALGMYSAYEGNGGVGGALSGAMSGMQLGMALGGPIGAGIGAAAGAIMGAIGFGGREKARVYDLKQVRPRLKNDIDGYQQGTMDYLGAYSDIEGLSRDANMTTNAMGPAAKSYYQDTIKKEIKDAEGKLTAEQRAGRSQYTTSAAQFDIGADSVPRDGMAMIHQRERIIPSDQNERITRALESGSSTMPVQQQSAGWGGDLHVHAIDGKGALQFLMNNKHQVRAAVNASFAENSGGADA